MRLPKVEHLVAFQLVAEQLSFTRAATLLNQSQSAVSHQIKKLEDELGVQLFNRSAHSVQLTIPGATLLSKIVKPLSELEHACQSVAKRRKSMRLSIELEPAFAAHWLNTRLPAFTAKHPKMQLDMHFSTHRFEFPSHVEVAIKWGTGSWPGCDSKKLLGIRMTPMCSASFHKRHEPWTVNNFRKLRLLHDRSFQFWSLWFEAARSPPSDFGCDFIFDDMNVLTAAALNDSGIMLGILEFNQQALNDGSLVALFPEVVVSPPQAYYLVNRKDSRLTNTARDFNRWLLAEVGS